MSQSVSGLVPSPPIIKRPSRAPLILISAVVLFLVLFAATTWQSWFPLPHVDVVRVVSMKPNQQPSAAEQHAVEEPVPVGKQSTAFQAAGWIEADPQVTAITSLISGVIQSVSVLDGQNVKQGQEIARLIDDDFRLAHKQSAAAVAKAQATLAEIKEQVAIATEHVLAHDHHHALAEAKIAEQQDIVDRYQQAGDAVSSGMRKQAELALASAKANLAAVHSDLAIRKANVKKYQAQVAVAEAQLQLETARHALSELNLERCIIRAPIDGTVQELFAYPGRKQMLGSDNPRSTTVATLYQSDALQARVDIALEDSAGLFIGQDAIITCNALPQKQFQGTVTRILGVADISRNTLQAKVKILDPIPLLRPDMLVKVQFLGSQKKAQIKQQYSSSHLAHYLPSAHVAARPKQLWIINQDMRLEAVDVSYGTELENMTEITSGLRAGMYVVVNPDPTLEAGMQVQIKERIHD